MAHGVFASAKAVCPHGCDTVERVFVTAPATRSARTANIDRTLNSLARSHGMTDISNPGGVAAKRMSGGQQQRHEALQQVIRERFGETGWGNVPAGKTFNAKTQQVEASPYRGDSAGSGVPGAIASYGVHPDNVLAELTANGTKDLPRKAVIAKRDPENLKVTDARPPA